MTPEQIRERIYYVEKATTREELLFLLGLALGKLKLATSALETYLDCPDPTQAKIALEDIFEKKIEVPRADDVG